MWPAFLCGIVWQILQFMPQEWSFAKQLTDPLTTAFILIGAWHYNRLHSAEAKILLAALVLFVIAGAIFAFLPFSYFIAGLAVFLLAHVVLCAINFNRLHAAWRSGCRPRLFMVILAAVCYTGLVGFVLQTVLPQVHDAVLANAIAAYTAVITVMAISAAAAAAARYQSRWWWAAIGGGMMAISDACLALRMFGGVSEAWVGYVIMPLYWGGIICYVASAAPARQENKAI